MTCSEEILVLEIEEESVYQLVRFQKFLWNTSKAYVNQKEARDRDPVSRTYYKIHAPCDARWGHFRGIFFIGN